MTNNFIYKIFILNNNEEVIRIARQSKWKLISGLIFPASLIIASFFFLFPLFYWGKPGITIFLFFLVIGLFLFTKNIVIWYFKILIITNQRIIDIDQEKLFHRTVSDISLIKIKDVFYRIRGISQTLTKTGDIRITLSDSATVIEINSIPKPQKIQQTILQLKLDQSKLNLNQEQLSAAELVHLVEKIKKGIDDEVLIK